MTFIKNSLVKMDLIILKACSNITKNNNIKKSLWDENNESYTELSTILVLTIKYSEPN